MALVIFLIVQFILMTFAVSIGTATGLKVFFDNNKKKDGKDEEQ